MSDIVELFFDYCAICIGVALAVGLFGWIFEIIHDIFSK